MHNNTRYPMDSCRLYACLHHLALLLLLLLLLLHVVLHTAHAIALLLLLLLPCCCCSTAGEGTFSYCFILRASSCTAALRLLVKALVVLHKQP